jgi:hypothetical protein
VVCVFATHYLYDGVEITSSTLVLIVVLTKLNYTIVVLTKLNYTIVVLTKLKKTTDYLYDGIEITSSTLVLQPRNAIFVFFPASTATRAPPRCSGAPAPFSTISLIHSFMLCPVFVGLGFGDRQCLPEICL